MEELWNDKNDSGSRDMTRPGTLTLLFYYVYMRQSAVRQLQLVFVLLLTVYFHIRSMFTVYWFSLPPSLNYDFCYSIQLFDC